MEMNHRAGRRAGLASILSPGEEILPSLDETATNRLKKRDAEGLVKEEDRSKFQAGVKRMAYAAAALADRSHSRGVMLLKDGDGIQIG
uniref:Uncharacterized protein n=1 Tax=Aegilops tauschii TaxID=37682 RepID=M8AWW5_AEGTA